MLLIDLDIGNEIQRRNVNTIMTDSENGICQTLHILKFDCSVVLNTLSLSQSSSMLLDACDDDPVPFVLSTFEKPLSVAVNPLSQSLLLSPDICESEPLVCEDPCPFLSPSKSFVWANVAPSRIFSDG